MAGPPRKKPKIGIGCLDTKTAYSDLIASVSALAHLHASIPSFAEATNCIRDVKALHARLDEYSRSLSSDKKTKKQKAERSPISAITPAQQEGDRVADSGEEITLQERRDRLDREGVMLWNRGSVIKQALLFKQEGKEAAAANEASGISEEQETRQMLALLRYAAARLVILGSMKPYAHDDLCRLLALFTTSTKELANVQDFSLAERAAQTSAELEQDLLARFPLADSEVQERKESSKSLVRYYLARAELAWSQLNVTIASYMMVQATADDSLICFVSSREIESVCTQMYDFAYDVFKNGSESAQQAPTKKRSAASPAGTADTANAKACVEWLERIMKLPVFEDQTRFEGTQPSSASEARLKEVLVQTMKLMYAAQREMASNAAERDAAEAILDQVLKLDPSVKAYRVKIGLLIKRATDLAELVPYLEAYIRLEDLTEEDVVRLIQHVRHASKSRQDVLNLFAAVSKALFALDRGRAWVHLPLLAFCNLLNASEKSVEELRALLQTLSGNDQSFAFPEAVVLVFQSILWSRGDSAVEAGDFQLAANWHLLATHSIFAPASHTTNVERSRRRAALCYLHAEDYARAEETVRANASDNASDYYILFLSAVRQGNEQGALRYIRAMMTSEGFCLDMLFWAAKQAQELDLPDLAKYCFAAILEAAQTSPGEIKGADPLLLARALLDAAIVNFRALGNHADQEDEQEAAFEAVLNQLVDALQIIRSYGDKIAHSTAEQVRRTLKDVGGICRLASQFAFSGCKVWQNYRIIPACQIAADLGDAYIELGKVSEGTTADVDKVAEEVVALRLASVVEEMGSMREYRETNPVEDESYAHLEEALEAILDRLDPLKTTTISNKSRLVTISMRFELLLWQARWDDASDLLEVAETVDGALKLLQKLCDMVYKTPDCPASLVTQACESIMATMSGTEAQDPAELATFVRAIVAINLERGESDAAIDYVKSAIPLIRTAGQAYPRSEIEWLATTSWNQGMDVFPNDDHAGTTWCETAIELSGHVAGYADMRDMMEKHYATLRQRYSTQRIRGG